MSTLVNVLLKNILIDERKACRWHQVKNTFTIQYLINQSTKLRKLLNC